MKVNLVLFRYHIHDFKMTTILNFAFPAFFHTTKHPLAHVKQKQARLRLHTNKEDKHVIHVIHVLHIESPCLFLEKDFKRAKVHRFHERVFPRIVSQNIPRRIDVIHVWISDKGLVFQHRLLYAFHGLLPPFLLQQIHHKDLVTMIRRRNQHPIKLAMCHMNVQLAMVLGLIHQFPVVAGYMIRVTLRRIVILIVRNI